MGLTRHGSCSCLDRGLSGLCDCENASLWFLNPVVDDSLLQRPKLTETAGVWSTCPMPGPNDEFKAFPVCRCQRRCMRYVTVMLGEVIEGIGTPVDP